ncbi:MAG: hypothetical protein K0R12_1071, partial [Gammaproteobacteria bacterium]|nr:hypothetical protein [Gammaproteobacteria bacterium]
MAIYRRTSIFTFVLFCLGAQLSNLAWAANNPSTDPDSTTPISQVQSGQGTDPDTQMMNSTQQAEPSHRHYSNNLTDLSGSSMSEFGWLGPISITNLYDDELGYMADFNIASDLSSRTAAAVELEGGPNIFRANGTFGMALNDKNRIKFTLEQLNENLNYDFITGSVREWDGQTAAGADYEYIVDKG